MLWLASKAASGKHELVEHELERLSVHLLGPMGIADVPRRLSDAAQEYIGARHLEREFGVNIKKALGEAVLPTLVHVRS
jgi:hypothetical protein